MAAGSFSRVRCIARLRSYTHSDPPSKSMHGVQGRFASHLCTSPSHRNKHCGSSAQGVRRLTRFLLLVCCTRMGAGCLISSYVFCWVSLGLILTDIVYTPLPSSMFSLYPSSSPTRTSTRRFSTPRTVSNAGSRGYISSEANFDRQME